MASIRTDLTLITVTGSIILIAAIGFAVDHFISQRLEKEFDQNLIQKAGALMMLTSQRNKVVEFDFADELMPEYERSVSPEYFQLAFYDSGLLEKSHSLGSEGLPHVIPKGEELIFKDMYLANGRSIRTLTLGFTPRYLNEDQHSVTRVDESEVKKRLYDDASRTNLILSIGVGREKIDNLVDDIHLYIVTAAIAFIILVFLLLRYAISRALAPLREISTQVETMDMTSLGDKLSVSRSIDEIAPLVKQLNHLLRRLEKSFQREQRFSSDVSHELRTPLAELRSIADVGSLYTDDREVLLQYFLDLRAISQQMESITSNLMMLSRCDNNHEPIEVEIVELDGLLANIVEQTKHLKSREGKISLKCDANLKIRSNEVKLRLILNNLLSNAISHGDASSEIRILTNSKERFAEIRVENSASELSPEDVDHLFERFWRKDSARSDAQHSGLGLALVKAIADLLGIEVRAYLDGNNILSIHLSKIIVVR